MDPLNLQGALAVQHGLCNAVGPMQCCLYTNSDSSMQDWHIYWPHGDLRFATVVLETQVHTLTSFRITGHELAFALASHSRDPCLHVHLRPNDTVTSKQQPG